MRFISAEPFPEDPARAAIGRDYLADEAEIVARRLAEVDLPRDLRRSIAARARKLVEAVRAQGPASGLDAFLKEYSLGTEEGIVLMCLAEALLRIPDAETANRLIRDKLGEAEWDKHLGRSDSWLVNASTWGLMLTGRIIRMGALPSGEAAARVLKRLIARSGEPVIRESLVQAMRILGRQFVMGRNMAEALDRAQAAEKRGYCHSYDMLGEAARTAPDAARYLAAYRQAIAAIGAAARKSGAGGAVRTPGISVKLSALHPRYEFAQGARVMAELAPRLLALAQEAKAEGIGLTVDAEEADRLTLSLDLFERVYGDPSLAGWEGLGLAVQAYQKRARPLVDWIAALARRHRRRIAVRLVKGAYWDSEIKRAQERGLADYPVFTRKAATDLSYLACAKALLAAREALYPQFATHNAHTLAAVLEMAGGEGGFEFQRLHGMGENLYDPLVASEGLACRIYAPVGSHEDLLPYLVRRLLENGANTSFVNRLSDLGAPVESLIADPIETMAHAEPKPHPRIPRPRDLFRPERANSTGIELADAAALNPLARAMQAALEGESHHAAALIAGREAAGPVRERRSPTDRRRLVGTASETTPEALSRALETAFAAAPSWDAVAAEKRAVILERAADLLEERRARFMALAVAEAGKTIPDALAEVREAADFLRYYAARSRIGFAVPGEKLPGPTGEDNRLRLAGRGVFACIAPWNFPLAIFTGQVAAALAAGNAVIAKPAEQTPLIAFAAVRLLHEAGVPAEALHLLPGGGEAVGAPLVADPRIAGVAFTGSTEVAKTIARALAERGGPIVPLIAETGGQNAMIVDSSALPEQVVQDAVLSAFGSAGQRCSALRVLFVQEEVAERIVRMLKGAMAELVLGDPARLASDIGPVIDAEAQAMLEAHIARLAREAALVARAPLPPEASHGTFVAPHAFEIERIGVLQREVFGPVLHVVRYAADRLERVIDDINATGYGLTLGIHSRIEGFARDVAARARVGNVYVNRNMIGAVVGVQPFGGEGLSGTGPKAGGPHYLPRFATERVVSINTTASGGNASLLSLAEGGGDEKPSAAPGG